MKHIESKTQQNIVKYLRDNKIFVFAVPNGGKRRLREATIMKAEGVTAGVSDLIILLPQRAVFVEMKQEKTKQTDTQKTFQASVQALGFEYYVWRSIDDAIKFVDSIKK